MGKKAEIAGNAGNARRTERLFQLEKLHVWSYIAIGFTKVQAHLNRSALPSTSQEAWERAWLEAVLERAFVSNAGRRYRDIVSICGRRKKRQFSALLSENQEMSGVEDQQEMLKAICQERVFAGKIKENRYVR